MKKESYTRRQFCTRLTALRMDRNISAREMSFALGQSASYMNKIDNEKTLPSMELFYDICDYLEITPAEFFNTDPPPSPEISTAINEMNKMSKEQIQRMVALLRDINRKKK